MNGKTSGCRQFEGKRVLVVDNDGRIGSVLAELLSRYCSASYAPSGRLALAQIAQDPPDVVLVDVNLADMSGLELARTVRQRGNRSIAIVAMTGFHIEKPQCLAAGCNDLMIKPFATTELLERLSALLPT